METALLVVNCNARISAAGTDAVLVGEHFLPSGADRFRHASVLKQPPIERWQEHLRAAVATTFNALSVVAIGLLLSLVIGVLLTRSLVGPLRELVGEATAVSTGDVDLRVARFDTRSGDDITREVASAFDRMLNALRFYALADEGARGDD